MTIGACTTAPTSNRTEDNTVSQTDISTNLQDIQSFFDLSALPIHTGVMWQSYTSDIDIREDSLPAPNDYAFLLILEYDEDVESLAQKLQLPTRNEVFVQDNFVQAWMPDVIYERFSKGPDGYTQYTGTAYSALPLLNAPLSFGYALFIENYILIYAATL
jgi:hypothetical protein